MIIRHAGAYTKHRGDTNEQALRMAIGGHLLRMASAGTALKAHLGATDAH